MENMTSTVTKNATILVDWMGEDLVVLLGDKLYSEQKIVIKVEHQTSFNNVLCNINLFPWKKCQFSNWIISIMAHLY